MGKCGSLASDQRKFNYTLVTGVGDGCGCSFNVIRPLCPERSSRSGLSPGRELVLNIVAIIHVGEI